MIDEFLTSSTTSDVSSLESAESVPTGSFLFVVLHCDHPLLGGARYNLSRLDVVEIGRGSARSATHTRGTDLRRLDVRIPSSTVSKSHARLLRDRHSWFLEDMGSRNGCFVNGRRIVRTQLTDGDFIEVGSTFLRFRADLAAPEGNSDDVDIDGDTLATMDLLTLLPRLAHDLALIDRVARSPMTALLVGETGTGKEVLARHIHTISGRTGPFIAVNCGALTASLVEAQLFGHVRGSFTGALRDELGFVRSAHGGTLFLDEIGDLPLSAQAALLRVLQEREVIPVGTAHPTRVDLRVVAAAQEPIENLCLRGEFRNDLLARLASFQYTLAPLNARMEDIGLLIGKILLRAHTDAPHDLRLSIALMRKFVAYGWPLNIRELEQILTLTLTLAKRATLDLSHLPPKFSEGSIPPPTPVPESQNPEDLQRTLVALFEKHRGNVSHIARDMGKSRVQIHRWMQRFGIRVEDYRL